MINRFPLALRLALIAVFVFNALAVAFGSSATPPAQAQAAPPRTVFVHLFEWKWTDIAQECETFLGPRGYAAVQVSPPMEHAWFSQNGTYPWWLRYQPVSYQLTSRSGTRAEFANMVSRCRAVGVDIYVDAVINHMTGVGSGTGFAGSTYTPYTYPGLYQSQDFHNCGRYGDNDIRNYSDRWEVQNCELVNLADLNTGATYVRGRLVAYMNDLLSLGVAGFRIDAAKHMDTNDIKAIVNALNNTTWGARPYIYQEVIDQGGEPIAAGEYLQNGDVTEFKYSIKIGEVFRTGKLDWLSTFGPTWGFMASADAVVFTDNHDNQRGHGGAGGVLTFKDGALYTLGNVFALAWPYGYPQVMSSFNFSNGDQGPASDGSGNTIAVYQNGANTCFNGNWICEHRWREIANMAAFRNYTQDFFGVSNWWSNGNNQIAFGRGGRGFVVINRESGALNRTFQTGMAAGTYCDVIAGDFVNGTCTGRTITVDSAGNASIALGGMYAAAIHVGARLNSTPVPPTATPAGPSVTVNFNVNATTIPGENVFVVGNIPALGAWNTANAVPLSSANYPVWSASLSLPANTAIEFKYIKRNGNTVVWESIANRAFTTPASGTVTRNDTWNTASTTPTSTPAPTNTPAPTSTPVSSNSTVNFKVNATTVWGQNVYVVGNIPALGSWNTANAILMSSATYPNWTVSVAVPANTAVQFKYIKRDANGNVVWEGGSNRTFTSPASGGTLNRNDTWQP